MPKQKEEQVEDSSLDPSSSACDIRIQKKGISRSFAESFPQKIVSAKLRPHCSATCPNTWKAEPREKNTLSFHYALCACDQSVSGLLSKYIRNSSNEFRIFAEAGGFEPPIPLPVCRFSRAVPSTSRPRFHIFTQEQIPFTTTLRPRRTSLGLGPRFHTFLSSCCTGKTDPKQDVFSSFFYLMYNRGAFKIK